MQEDLLIRTYRVTGGRIAEHWGLLDTARLLRQIGAPLDPQHACAVPRPSSGARTRSGCSAFHPFLDDGR
jgi:hypothetical protein